MLSSANQPECTTHAFPILHEGETTKYEPINERIYNSTTELNTISNDLKKNLTRANNDVTTECMPNQMSSRRFDQI